MIAKVLEEVLDYFVTVRVCQSLQLLYTMKSKGTILQLQFSPCHPLETCIS